MVVHARVPPELRLYVHVFFALSGLVFCLYLGSAWYDTKMTRTVTKKVRMHIELSTAKKD